MSGQSHKNIQLIKTLKQCIQQVPKPLPPQTLHLYKHSNSIPKQTIDQTVAKDISQYSQYLLKLLKYITEQIQKEMVSKQQLQPLQQQIKQLENEKQNYLKQIKGYRCQIDVLNMKIQQFEQNQERVKFQKMREKKYSMEFQNKLEKIKKDSEEGIKKIIEVSRSQDMKNYQRNNSLPSIHNYANRQKIGLLLLMNTPQHKPPKRKNFLHSKKLL